MSDLERHAYDVVVIGAGGAGLRAAIEARSRGLRTAIVCKSLFGKAHTVMAEGGIAASMGNVNSKDSWQVHFRDTMRGGKFLNHWRMAELHAKEAPDRVWELETWGALFDRTKDGRISQRNFGGHEYPRLAHVGDRTGLELIRTLQQQVVALQQQDHGELGDYDARLKVFAESTVTRILQDASGAVSGAFGYYRETGQFVVFEAPAVIIATGGIGKSFKVTSNSWEYTGDGHALALRAGGTLGILVDLNTLDREAIFVNFFGVPAATTFMVAKLALRTGADVLPVFAPWDRTQKKFLLKIGPAISFEATGEEQGDVRRLTQAFTNVVEDYVRRYPDQWLWIHRRWKTRPPGEPEIY
jgi:succinate dehydrogenase/fumarate reductase flavoprotein subunit